MSRKLVESLTVEEMDERVASAAKAAGYEEGFGVAGCDLSKPGYWAAYSRQSLEEQTKNNRLFDYLRTCAMEAKKLGAVVPREYVLYDAVTGEHLQRPQMIRLRKLMSQRVIEGVIFPALDRLTREPLHQGIFEMEAGHYRVRLHFADAPNGTDPGSQFTRSILIHAAKLVKVSNRKNAIGGNIGRVVKGSVPAHRAPFGYRYRADREIGSDARVIIKKAWWEVDELGPGGEPLEGSPAWVVVKLFEWTGNEERTLYWVANKLNTMGITSPQGGKWSPNKVVKILHHRCYTGDTAYNVNARVSNPSHLIGDITAEIKRTLLKPKPEEEWAKYKVPKLMDEALWKRANENVTRRGRGRGKEGKKIQALLRNRIFCPGCSLPMVVRRNGRQNRVYYHCSKYCRPWMDNPCSYRRFIPGTWDDIIWSDVCALLRDDAWVENQLSSRQSQVENVEKLIRLEGFKVSQAKAKIMKVQEGFEGGIYSLEEARQRLSNLHSVVARGEEELMRLKTTARQPALESANLQAVVEELHALRNKNLDEVTFEERLEVISKFGVKVYPSEDLKSMKVQCRLNLHPTNGGLGNGESEGPQEQAEDVPVTGCGIVKYAPPLCSHFPRTPTPLQFLHSVSRPLRSHPHENRLTML
ncbi:MAG: recombinase family protein [Chloroflexi bacterium]|nr:recombinase family protein [Chloroflexota bacterium]